MKTVLKITMMSICLTAFSSCYRNYTEEEMIGVYVNNYSEEMREGIFNLPSRRDTLIIFNDGRFHSGIYGNGHYEISQEDRYHHPLISLNDYERDPFSITTTGFSLPVMRKNLFNKTPRIIIIHDLNYFYEKIEDN